MAEQQRKSKSKSDKEQIEEVELKKDDTKAEEIKDDLDDLLDEIDGVLETNAEEFVKNYVQKGKQQQSNCYYFWNTTRKTKYRKLFYEEKLE